MSLLYRLYNTHRVAVNAIMRFCFRSRIRQQSEKKLQKVCGQLVYSCKSIWLSYIRTYSIIFSWFIIHCALLKEFFAKQKLRRNTALCHIDRDQSPEGTSSKQMSLDLLSLQIVQHASEASGKKGRGLASGGLHRY